MCIMVTVNLSHAGLPRVSSVQVTFGTTSPLALNCTSTGSPALTVVWTKDGRALPSDLSYTTNQVLRDGTSATYDNFLLVSGYYSELVGIYNCIVHDSLGRNSVPASLQVNGNGNQFTVKPANDLLSCV